MRAPAPRPATDVAGTIDGGSGVKDPRSPGRAGRPSSPRSPSPSPDGGPRRRSSWRPTASTAPRRPRAGRRQAIRLVTAATGRTPSGGAAGADRVCRPGEQLTAAPTGVRFRGSCSCSSNAETLSPPPTRGPFLAVSGESRMFTGRRASGQLHGGATLREPKRAPPRPNHGWAWVGAPGGATFYALSGDGSGWDGKSRDRGRTWSQVVVAGRLPAARRKLGTRLGGVGRGPVSNWARTNGTAAQARGCAWGPHRPSAPT